MGNHHARCLVRLNTVESTPVLVAAHGWGGHVFDPRQLGPQLGKRFSVFGLRPREQAGGQPHTEFATMCRDYAAEIAATLPSTPIVLYGYSLGGTIAYAVASELHQRGHPVAEVIAIDAYPSNLPMPIHLVSILPYLTRRTLVHLSNVICKPAGLLRYIKQRRQALNTIVSRGGSKDGETPRGTDDHRSLQSDDPGADYHQSLADHYTPSPCAVDVTLVRCRRTPSFLYPRWRYLCRAKLRVFPVDFTHHNLISDAGLAVVSDLVIDRLRQLTRQQHPAP